MQEGVETALAEPLPAYLDDETARALGDPVEGVGREVRGGEQTFDHRRLVLPVGGKDGRAKPRCRSLCVPVDEAHWGASAERSCGIGKPSRRGSSGSITKSDVPE